MTRGDQRCSEYFSRGVAGLRMLLGNPTRLEKRSVGNKLFTVCMYGYGLAATALLQKCSTRQRAPAVGMPGFGAVHGAQSNP